MSDLQSQVQDAVGDAYRILRELPAGGMSRIFLADEERLDRKVVVKVLPPEMAAGVSTERFEREIRLAARLQHPHIVPVLTTGATPDLLYYVMPYIDGQSLREVLAQSGKLPIGQTLRLLRGVASALAHAHQHGVVHRDIKPENVLLAGDLAVVMDFGVAKAVTESTSKASLTSMGMALGTPAYMSPEQASGDPNVDHRADLYSFGALAYEMVTGRPPFSAGNAHAVLSAHMTKIPDPVERHREDVPAGLADLIMRCLEKDPVERWQSAEEIRGVLESLTTPSGGTAAVRSVSAETMIRRSHPLRVAVGFSVGTGVALAAAYLLMVSLGLPTWAMTGTIALLTAAFPFAMLTGWAERRRAKARVSGAIRSVSGEGYGRWLTWRRARFGGAVGFGGLALAVVLYMGMRHLGIGPVGTLVASGVLAKREPIVLAQFDNRTADSTLGGTVTELLRIDLTQSPTVTVTEPSRIGEVLGRMQRDPDTPLTADLAVELAQREGIKAVVTGEILSVGSEYVVVARLVAAASGEVLAAGRETAAGPDAIVGAVDRLSARLRERIGESLRTIRAESPLGEVTTASTHALRLYTEAISANDAGDPERAVELLQEAIDADTAFAMAYRKLGVVLGNLGGRPQQVARALTKAYELRDRLTFRERQYAAAAYHSIVRGDGEEGIAEYRALLERYPTDPIALNNLALLYAERGRWAEAEVLLLRSIASGIVGPPAFTNAANVLSAQGKWQAADSVLALFDQGWPNHPAGLTDRAFLASAQGDYETARRLLLALQERERDSEQWQEAALAQLADIAEIRGRLAEAWRLRQDAIGIRHDRGLIQLPRALTEALASAERVLWYHGDTATAVRALEGALARHPLDDVAPEARPYLALVSFYAQAGRAREARRWYGRWEAEVDAETRGRQEVERRIQLGNIATAEGRHDDAIVEYLAAREEAKGCGLCALFEIARAHDGAGRPDSAAVWYERFLETPAMYRVGSDGGTKPLALKRLGELYEQAGDAPRALEYYDRFLQLWGDVDLQLQPYVADVRARVAALVGEA